MRLMAEICELEAAIFDCFKRFWGAFNWCEGLGVDVGAWGHALVLSLDQSVCGGFESG